GADRQQRARGSTDLAEAAARAAAEAADDRLRRTERAGRVAHLCRAGGERGEVHADDARRDAAVGATGRAVLAELLRVGRGARETLARAAIAGARQRVGRARRAGDRADGAGLADVGRAGDLDVRVERDPEVRDHARGDVDRAGRVGREL